ncbi:hypothetical protein ABZZ47_33670 [Streptomyces sp. NPDC006465]
MDRSRSCDRTTPNGRAATTARRKAKGSNNRTKARITVARAHG